MTNAELEVKALELKADRLARRFRAREAERAAHKPAETAVRTSGLAEGWSDADLIPALRGPILAKARQWRKFGKSYVTA